MDFNETNIDPDVLEFYRPKPKPSSQSQNRSSIPVSQQQQHQQQQHQQQQQQQILYQQHVQQIQQNQQQIMKQRPTQSQMYYQKQPIASQAHPANPQQIKPAKIYRTPDYQHQPVNTSHSSSNSGNSGSNTNTGSGTSLKAKDLLTLLKHGIALLPGGRDKRGGPVLCFPANSHADEFDIEDLYVLVRYLTFLPDENVKKLKFSVVIDMRAGTTWHSVKPILKVLEECIGQCTGSVFIIKPDKFLEKQKTQMACSKFMFDIQIVSVNALYQEIDQSQLTRDFDGALPYNNDEWIQIRICLEEFFTLAHDMSDKFTSLYKFLDRKDTPETVIESKRRVEDHKSVRLKIIQAPVHILESEGDKLGHWLRYGLNAQNQGRPSWVTMNPDYQQLIPQVKKTVQQLYEYRSHLQHKWEVGRSRLEQIYQLRLFEDDIGRMSEWLNQQRHLFLTEYHDIGQTASQAADLYAEHRQFLVNCSDVREQVSRLTGVANMLTDSGHFASQQIQGQARKLDHDWKSFTTALEDRSNVLQLSASFHSRAEAFLANCPHWETAMKQQQIQPGQPETVNSLNQYIQTLQQLWQEARMAHEEVCSDGRALASHLSSPVPKGSHTSLAAAVDYTDGRKHCTHLMHEVWACFKRVETVQANRYKRLTARLSLLMFREDVAQVLAWLNEHGEPFLKRQTSVGKTLQRAEQLYNAHMQFEEVAANTLTNAEKLILAADELVSQAHDPEEILQEQTELERRIKAFTKAVENRRNTLDLAVGFHNHTKDLFKWFHQLKENHNAAEMLPLTIEGVEDELRRFHNEKRNILDAADKVLKEGSALCSRLIEEDEKNHFKVLLMQVQNDKETATDLLTERQVRLDLCLQLRLFEADVSSAIDCLKHEVPTPMTCHFLNDPRLARSMNELEEVTATFLAAIKSGEEVIQKGSELSRAFESVGVNFPAGGSGSNDSGVVDSAEYAVERIQRLSYELTDLVMAVDEVNIKLKIELDWRRLEQQSQQVLTWISQCDEMLRQTALVPSNLIEAEQLQMEHDKFQPILNEAHPQAVTCAAFAEMYIQQITYQLGPENDPGSVNSDLSNHNLTSTIYSRRKEAQNIAELVADQWQKLVYAAEEKHKLLIAAGNWYKTSDQVTSVLRSLEKEYRRAEDWCQNEKASSRGDQVTYLGDLLSRHFEQKEAFLKACILARRTSEQFIKYLGRQPAKTPGKASVQEKVDASIKDLMVKEQAVLQAWAARKSRLDECLDFIRVKAEADELISNYDEAGVSSPKLDETYKRLILNLESKNLSQHIEVIKSIKNRLNLRFANQFLIKSNQISSGPAGAAGANMAITQLSSAQTQPTKLRTQLSSGSNYGSGDLNRSSMSSTGSGGSSKTTDTTTTSGISISSGVSQVQEKAAKKRIHLINEMIQTEIFYVSDLETYLKTYYKAITEGNPDIKVPQDLVMRKDVLFSNIKEILDFHKNVFLPEITQYDPTNQSKIESNTTCCFLPEDIGHCFIRYANDFKKIYVKYFANKDEGNQIMMEKMEFFNELMSYCFSGEEQMKNTIQSFWIKPVQRITKYTIFLKDLSNNCDVGSAGELSEAWEVMLEMNKRINDEIHLKDIKGLPEDRPLESLGDFILMDDFTVWEPRQIIKKGRDRRVFLFDVCLVLTKKYNHDDTKIFYQYKSHILLTECNITEHIEGDQCKFALWTGRVPPMGEYRLVLKGKDLEIKQKWVRALRETMQERIFSFGPIFEESQRTRMTSSTSDVARNVDNIFYVMDNFTAMEASQISVLRNQRVQLLEQHGEWASVRTINTTTDSVNEDLSKQQGLVPASLLISVSTRRYLVDDKSINSSTMKKWLRDRRHGPVRRGSKVENQSVRPIPTPIIPSNNLPSCNMPTESSVDNILLDNVSEESVDVELPPPMALQEFPVVLSPNNAETGSNASSSAPSSQTTDSNSAEPSKESQIEPQSYGQESHEPNNMGACSTPIKDEMRQMESAMNTQNHDQFSTIEDQDKRASSLTIKEFTMSPSQTNKMSAFTSLANQSSPNPGCVLPTELDELGMALEKNLRLSRQARQENERYQAWQQHITSGQHTGTLDSISSKASKASQESDRALSTSEMSQSSCSAAFPGLEEDDFDDSNHSPILVAPQILDLPGNGDEKLLGELRLSDDMNVAGRLWSPNDDEMVEDVSYNFISRRLLLYETGLILINEVIETCPSMNSDLNSGNVPSIVRCKHLLSLARLSIKEDVDMSEGRRSANKLLWFCLYEEVSANQSVLCHIIDPITPDVRARWLTELTQMIQMEKSKQYAINSSLVNNSNIGALASANGSIASFNMASHNPTNIKVPTLFQLKTDPIEIDFKAKSSSKLNKKSEKSLSSSKKSNKSDSSTSVSKKEGKYRISGSGLKKPR